IARLTIESAPPPAPDEENARPDTPSAPPSAAFALERFTPGTFGPKSAYEHWSRYLFAAPFATRREVLDYGCGTGFGTRFLAAEATRVLGLDVAADAVAYARQHHAHPRCRYEHSPELPAEVPAASFDLIVCFEVIEHLLPQDELLRQFARILRPGGVLLVSTPDPRYTTTLGENPYHVREFTPEEFSALVGRHFAHVQQCAQTPLIGESVRPVDADDAACTVRVLGFDQAA